MNQPSAVDAVDVVRKYAHEVFRRAREPMLPPGFAPDWDDAPSKYKTYPDRPRLAAPRWTGGRLGDFSTLLADPAPAPADAAVAWSPAAVAALAGLAYGVRGRRLAPNWNQDLGQRSRYPGAAWGRATASGGGMYPLEIYWVVGTGTAVRPGVYHFHTGHHAWQRLATGDQTAALRRACLGAPAAAAADQFLVVTARFWKNAFKYHRFCLHVVTQDLGALLGSWHLVARGLGQTLRPVLWFADEQVNDRLGLVTAEESALAVVPLPTADRSAVSGAPAPGVRADLAVFERSRRPRRFDHLTAVHRATLVTDEPRPPDGDGGTEPVAGSEGVALPPLPARWGADLADALRRRRSSFGRFSRHHPLTAAEVGGLLAAAGAAGRLPDDLTGPHGPAPRTGLHAIVNAVDGIAPGGYSYDPAGHRLRLRRPGPPAGALQRAYLLHNYNLHQVGAVLAVSAPLDAALEHYGPRGLRLLNAAAGAAAQFVYLAAAATGVDCGAVLGFDNEAVDDLLGLTGTGERTLLYLLVGHDRPGTGDFVTATGIEDDQ